MSPSSSYFAPRKALIILLGLTASLAVAKVIELPQCAATCAQTAATALNCHLDDTACLCAHPGFARGAEACAQSVCQTDADRKTSNDAFEAFAASCGSSTVTVTTTQSGSTTNTNSASNTASSSGTNSASHSGSSTKTTSTHTTGTESTAKQTPTTTTSATLNTVTGTVTQSASASVNPGSTTTTTTSPTLTPLLPPTSPSGTAVVMQTVTVPNPSASPISAAYSVHVSSVWSIGALSMGLAGVFLF